MTFPKQTTVLFLAVATGLTAFSGLSGSTGIARAEPDPMARYESKINVGVRYPGDAFRKNTTVRVSGPDQGAYVERCSWSLKANAGSGFGITQTCVRYKLTKDRTRDHSKN